MDTNLRPNIKIATIMDEMVYEWFKYEGILLQLQPADWKERLKEFEPDLLFVQSAWEGHNKQWYLKICDLEDDKDNTLTKVLTWCREAGVPTAFWNMEDPYHFNHFISAASLFDFVFTTDANCVSRYKLVLGHDKVFVLPFAAQPRIHNPIGKGAANRGQVAFAGTWYRKGHDDRKKDMEIVLKPAFKYGLHIYDRMSSYTRSDYYKYPSEYEPFIKPGVPYSEMLDLYKKYDIFLNVNTINNSPTMFACRVMELLACGTTVISGYALGIEVMLPGLVSLCKRPEDTARHLDVLLRNKELRDRQSLLAQREVFCRHTYTHRITEVLENIFKNYSPPRVSGVSIITCCNQPGMATRILTNYSRQCYPVKELIVITNHSNPDTNSWDAVIKEHENVRVFHSKGLKSFVEFLNCAMQQANYDFIANFDSDSLYCENYLTDLMNVFKFSDAQVIGKRTHFTYNRNTRELAVQNPGNEYRSTKQLPQDTLIISKHALLKVLSSVKATVTLTAFWEECKKLEIQMFSADRFNYVRFDGNTVYKTGPDQSPEWKQEVIMFTEDFMSHVTV